MLSGTGWLEGISQELAHWKGYAMGVYIEDWEHIIFQNTPPKREWIENAPCPKGMSTEDHALWVSRGVGFQPLRVDKLRPIGALFQEIWCCVTNMQYHLKWLPLVKDDQYYNETVFEGWYDWARGHVIRTMKGHRDMLEIAEPVPGHGEQFWHGYCSWVDELEAEAYHVYDMEGYTHVDEYQW
jgi:hypothetical protein